MSLGHQLSGRMRQQARERCERAVNRALGNVHLMRFLPGERGPAVAPPWRGLSREAPTVLRRRPGIERDPVAEEQAFDERPLRDFFVLHGEATRWFLRHVFFQQLVATMPRMQRSNRRARLVRSGPPAPRRAPLSAQELTERIRQQGLRLGLSNVGFAAYDPKYTFADYAGAHSQGTVIVCVMEQDYAATQTIPSTRAEKAALHGYAEVVSRAAQLGEFVKSHGYRAEPHDALGETIVIHYGVQAGLGQLGLNGQLLTPAAGSRVRISVITTDAELVHGEPVDYGLEAICDSCQACVRRCPVGAIPRERRLHRGVRKIKIKTERCFPVVVQADGCAVCMKVCPVQRYGLEAVWDHFEQTGTILGRGSDELEGFHWPLDGRFYGASEKPRIDSDKLLRPEGLILDVTRTEPVSSGRPV